MSDLLEKTPFSENTLSVSEVNATIKACIDSPIFKGLEVFGEVSGFKFSGPHAYFTLKDKDSCLQCVCFYAAKTYNPKDGESVIVKGSLDYYVKGGRLSLQATSIRPVGKGLLFLEFEKLRAKLAAEGLFDSDHKKPIPTYCKSVLVVTSKTGAVIRDIVTTIRRKNPIVNIVVKDVRVQGEGAAHEISGALKRVDLLNYDVVVIARGGGSLEDLAPFYDEELVRTVYAMRTPTVSAVGHETDFSLCDFVADVRAATPTAAGELVAYDYYALAEDLKQCIGRAVRGAKRNFERAYTRSRITFERLRHVAASFYVQRSRRVENALLASKVAIERKFDAAERRTLTAVDMLDKLNPLKILRRGYFRITVGDKTVNSVQTLHIGDEIVARGGDGTVTATVAKIDINEEN